jgi:hypothetical protein
MSVPEKKAASPSLAPTSSDSEINSVLVRNIAPTVEPPTHKVLADFFSFCGNITALTIAPDDRDPSGQSVMAIVTFESKAAARTAVLLNNALINEKAIQVELAPPNFTLVSNANAPQVAVRSVPTSDLPQRHNVSAEDRSQTSVVVSLLAKGYTLSDTALSSARQFDEQYSISKKTAELRDQAAQGIRNIDQQLGVSATLQNVGNSLQAKVNDVNETFQVSQKAQAASNVLNEWGKSFNDTIQGAAQSTAEYVNTNPTLSSAAQTVQGWGSSIASVFKDARTLSDQEQAILAQQQLQKVEVLPDQPIDGATSAPAPAPATSDPSQQLLQ